MEYSRIQKIIYWLKCKQHFPDIQQSFNYSDQQSGSIMILLPDTDIAFDFSELILNEASSEIKDKCFLQIILPIVNGTTNVKPLL